jgi:membrane protease YdiL (CAAX protease family)
LSALWRRVLLFVLGAVACVLLYLFLLNFPPVGRTSRTGGLIPVAVLAGSTALLTARFLQADRLGAAVLGLDQSQRPGARFGLGFLAGCALVGGWFCIVTIATGASWHRNATFSVLALSVAVVFNFFNNIGEELVYRGYLFVRLAGAWGSMPTILVTSGVFALLHLQAGIPLSSVVAAVFTSALIFAAIFARWRSLPLALGFHLATNVAQDALGLRPGTAALFAPVYPADAANAGGAVLGGIAVLNVAVAIALLAWPRRRHGSRDAEVRTAGL